MNEEQKRVATKSEEFWQHESPERTLAGCEGSPEVFGRSRLVLVCPQCFHEIVVDSEATFFVCPYCGGSGDINGRT